MSRGVPVRITQGIAPQHSRVGFVQAMSSFGEVVYCRKPPYSGIPGEDYVNIGFATQSAAEKCYAELRAGRLMVEGVVVGVGPVSKEPLGSGGGGCSNSGGGGAGAGGVPKKLLLTSTSRCCCAGPTKLHTPPYSAKTAATIKHTANTELRERAMFFLPPVFNLKN